MARKALCIGINNYPGTNMDLQGCVNDANDWATVLKARGFGVEQLVDAQATKAKMVEAMRKLIGSGESGDSLVITYSGHGTYAPDADGDEPDGLDEALCPYDIHQGHALIDDEIHQLFAARKPGVRIVLISDSCHSGTVTRNAPTDTDADADGTRARFLPMGNWLPDNKLPHNARGTVASKVSVNPAASAFLSALSLSGGDLLMAGCEEGPNNFSYDAKIAGRFNGAFSYYALKALKEIGDGATYSKWHKAIREHLPSASYPQAPQIFGGRNAKRYKVLA
jgi:metacaspase-1